MSNKRLQTLLDRMPSQYARDEDSNNYKLLKMIAQNSVENLTIQQTILKFWDVDQSDGYGLDRLGKDEGISRGGWDDEEYRKMIKIQCIVNLSEGDIPTMNSILDAYMGDEFIGLQDGWKYFEPASILVYVKNASKSLPMNLIKKIKPAGVKVYWILEKLLGVIRLQLKSYSFQVPYPICNTFQTETLPGKLAKETMEFTENSYTFPIYAPICNTFVTAIINSSETNLNFELTNEYRDVNVLYRRASNETIMGEGEI